MVTDLVALKQNLEPRRGRVGNVTGSDVRALTRLTRYKRILLTAAALALLVLIVARVLNHPAAAAPIESIAVLPFINETGNPDIEFLSNGISDSLMNRLTSVHTLRVIPITSVLSYKGKPLNAQVAGQELKVRAVLIGWLSVRGDVLSVRAELVDVLDNRALWKEQYNNRKLSEQQQIEDEISRQLAAALNLRLTDDQSERFFKRETENNEAYRFYQRGRSQWARLDEEGLNNSIEDFKKAVEIDGNYSLAYSGLADSYSALGEMSLGRPDVVFDKARHYADKALNVDPSLAEALISRGIVKLFYERDWPGAKEALSQAKQLKPRNAHAYHFAATISSSPAERRKPLRRQSEAWIWSPRRPTLVPN